MALPTIPLILGGTALAAGLIWWATRSSSTSSGGSSVAASAAGQKDGCAQGTSDAKNGLAESYNPTDDAAVQKAATASGDAAAYNAAYAKAYSSCFESSAPAPAPSPSPSPAPKPVTPPPGVKPGVTINRAQAESAYGSGCDTGSQDGYADGFRGMANAPHPSGASSSGNAAAYTAAYKQAYASGYSKGASDSAAGMAEPGAPAYGMGTLEATDTLEMRVLGIMAGCSGGFDSWLAIYIGETGAKVSGGAFVGRYAPRELAHAPHIGQSMQRRPNADAMGGGDNRHQPRVDRAGSRIYRSFEEA